MLRLSLTVPVLLFGAFLVESPLEVGPADPELFSAKGCAVCHGADAGGDFGPALASTGLTYEGFLSQLRAPRGRMPTFAADAVSDGEARVLFDFVKALDPPSGSGQAGAAGTGDGCRCGHHACGHHGGRHHGSGRGAGACQCDSCGDASPGEPGT